jgi:hypothetical protein
LGSLSLPALPRGITPVRRRTRSKPWIPAGTFHKPRFPLRSTNPDQVEVLGSLSYRTEAGSRRLAEGRFRLGLVAGTAGTSGFHLGAFDAPQDESLPYAGGLSLEAGLRGRLPVELDGLYRPLHAVSQYQSQDGRVFENPFTVLTWNQVELLFGFGF